METAMMFVAGGAIVIAILLWLMSLEKNKEFQSTNTAAMGTMSVPSPTPSPLPHEQDKRGWKEEVTTKPAPAVEEPVGTETIASHPEPDKTIESAPAIGSAESRD